MANHSIILMSTWNIFQNFIKHFKMNFKNLQLILLINIFLLAIHSPAFCQNDNYSKVINGNRVNYSKGYSRKNYTVLNKNGFKTYSGVTLKLQMMYYGRQLFLLIEKNRFSDYKWGQLSIGLYFQL